MIAIGIDLSVTKAAIGGVRADGNLATHTIALNPGLNGAHRLKELRATTRAVLGAYRAIGVAVLVEQPPNPTLRDMAAVAMEAAQAAIPGAVVMSIGPTGWKLESVGRGNATKPECLEFARALGYEGDDQDLAESLCMADVAWSRWKRAAA